MILADLGASSVLSQKICQDAIHSYIFSKTAVVLEIFTLYRVGNPFVSGISCFLKRCRFSPVLFESDDIDKEGIVENLLSAQKNVHDAHFFVHF